MASMLGGIQKFVQIFMNNRILFIILSFIVYMLFFDEYNLKTKYKVNKTSKRLEEQKASYINLIQLAKQDKVDLEQNYEKFAREKFKMSKADEDIFIIEPKKIQQ